ncbi:inorganic phosphate transporter Pho87p [[Candida] anglica]|uniref:Inorganic phosphate transporter Pho87p n=1 Tax=[Candida] anglica TaxID=148631 RepID=A0ABP0E9I8_9ASCO
MKFEHSLKFNVVPEWQDEYVNYPALKKTIYRLQQLQLGEDIQQHQEDKTVTEVVLEQARLRDSQLKKNAVNDHHNGSSISDHDTSDGTDEKLASKLVHRFKRGVKSGNNKNGSSSNSLGNGILGKFSGGHSNSSISKGSPSVESFTVDLENSTVKSLLIDLFDEVDEENSEVLLVFIKQLLEQLSKVDSFYAVKEPLIFSQYANLEQDLKRNDVDVKDVYRRTQAYAESNPGDVGPDLEKRNTLQFERMNEIDLQSVNSEDEDEDDDEDEDEDEDEDDYHIPAVSSALLDHSHFHVDQQKRIALKKKSVDLFIQLSELKSYIELNRMGFTKITKKFDKTCGYSIKQDFVQNFMPNNSRVFLPQTIAVLDAKILEVTKVYALLVEKLDHHTSRADLDAVKHELKAHLRDHVVWERNTVWKDLLSLEKKSYNLELHKLASSSKIGDEGNVPRDLILNLRWKRLDVPFTNKSINVPASLLTWQIVKLAAIITLFVVLMTVKTMNDPEQHRCLAVLATSAALWATEALPLYITSMLVPFLVVTCKVLKNPNGVGHMSGPAASAYIFSQMWSSVIMLLMGGFTLAAALSKYNIAKVVSSYILAAAGTKPRNVLLAIMSVSLFLSMWISNVAAPVLCFSLIQPVLRTLPTESPFAQALVLGIALASNMAGMASPIASPQNVIAIESMNPNPGWGKWFAVALPVSIIGMLGIWAELIFTFKIHDVKVKQYKPITERLTTKQWYVSIITVATILLWCLLTKMDNFFGESGVISIVPIILFFGTGLLNTSDLNNFPWNIIVLAMGGIALGKAVSSSGLLATIARALQQKIMDFDVFVVLIIFGILILVVATFVSHTVAALIIIPLVKEVGENLATPHPLLLVMGTALLASAAMGLPTSGFPNVTAISMTDEMGKPYLTVNTFITRGVPASIIGYIVVITVGYGIMTAINF